MALTDNCHVYAALKDAGVNRVVRHLMQQRPSWVNYATPAIARLPELLCEKVDAAPIVTLRGDPLVTVLPPLPVFGSTPPVAVNYSLQLRPPTVDFSPGNEISLPPELDPLAAQSFALRAGACFGYGCPDKDLRDRIKPYGPPRRVLDRGALEHRALDRTVGQLREVRDPRDDRELGAGRGDVEKDVRPRRPDHELDPRGDKPPREPDVFVFPVDELLCTCLDLYATAKVDFAGSPTQHLEALLTGLELVDLAPTTLEDSIECYLKLLVRYSLFPHLRPLAIEFVEDLLGIASVAIAPTVPPVVPNNPALEDDQLKIFLDVDIDFVEQWGISVNPGGSSGGGGPGAPPPPQGVVRPRTRTDDADLTVALNEELVDTVFADARDGFRLNIAGNTGPGVLSLAYDVDAHFENGEIDFNGDGTISLQQLDIVWDSITGAVSLDIPTWTWDPPCVEVPIWGCVFDIPPITLFGASPEITVPLALPPFRTEVSTTITPVIKYLLNPGRQPWMNDWDARDNGVANLWQLCLSVSGTTIDLLEIHPVDIFIDVHAFIRDALRNALRGLLPDWLDWAADVLVFLAEPLILIIAGTLALGGALTDLVVTTLLNALGINDANINAFLAAALADPILEIPDPFPVIDGSSGLVPVLIPVEHIGLDATDPELTLTIDIGN